MTWAVTAFKVAAPYIAAGSQVISAFQSLQAGRQQSEAYKLQARQAQLKAQRDALQYEQQGNLVLENLLKVNATAAAKGFASGTQGFSGSAKLTQERSEKVAGRDLQIMQQGAKEAASFGEIQSAMLTEAADQAVTGSYFDAISKVGTAAYLYTTLKPGSKPTAAAA
jgi:1-aminocyclopropane-1-carboxylate deaminase/D-cysteine desulfhydrase-like pyridoxal-dependent ACC family enzyme